VIGNFSKVQGQNLRISCLLILSESKKHDHYCGLQIHPANENPNAAGLSTSAVIIPNTKLMAKYKRTLNTLHAGVGNIFDNPALVAAYEQGESWLEQLLDCLGKRTKGQVENTFSAT
jgi:bifunctional pyridoxal-dependent enzyme with beta-cystathionase and maltose regulon repressor activities